MNSIATRLLLISTLAVVADAQCTVVEFGVHTACVATDTACVAAAATSKVAADLICTTTDTTYDSKPMHGIILHSD